MVFSEEERPLAIQIYGSDADTMAEAARIVEEVGADICDINMGCPANKVLKGCAGAALMGDPRLAEEIVRRCREVVSIPLTVKFRLGLDSRNENFVELGRICEANGADAVALHGRTAKQMFGGSADWSKVAELKEAVSIPVFGNGDVREADDAVRMLAETGCDGVMIGRGATRNPWIFRQVEARLSGGRIEEPTLEDRRELILGHFRMVAVRGGVTLRAPQAAQVHGLVHPWSAPRPSAAPANQPAPRRRQLPRRGRGVLRGARDPSGRLKNDDIRDPKLSVAQAQGAFRPLLPQRRRPAPGRSADRPSRSRLRLRRRPVRRHQGHAWQDPASRAPPRSTDRRSGPSPDTRNRLASSTPSTA